MSAEISVQVPCGNHGIRFEDSSLSNDCYRTKVSFVSPESPLVGTIFQGDLIAKVNDVDVHNVDASGVTEMFQQSSQVQRVITIVRPSVATFELIDGDNIHPLPLSDILEKPFVDTSPMKKTIATCNDQRVNSGRDPHTQQQREFLTGMIVNPPSPRAVEETGHYEREASVRNVCDASIAEATNQVIANAVLVDDQEVFEAEIVLGGSQDTTTVQRRRPTYAVVLVVLIIFLGVVGVAILAVTALRDAPANNSQGSQISSVDGDSGVKVFLTVPSLRPSVWSDTSMDSETSFSAIAQTADNKQKIPTNMGSIFTERPTSEPTRITLTQGLIEESKAPQTTTGPTKEPTPQSSESPNNRLPTLSPLDSTPLLVQSLDSRAIAWLDAHNTRRKIFHEQYGKTYIPLVWSESLAAVAQFWADLLNDGNSCSPSFPNVGDFGQNIYASWSETSNELDAPENVLIAWVDGKEGLDYPYNGQLTQALWRASKYLGCGESIQEFTANRKTSLCRIYVCNYVRMGNCDVDSYKNWTLAVLMDDIACGVECPSEGCFWEASIEEN